MNEKEKRDRYFDRLQSTLPKGAEILSARGVFGRKEQSATFVYRLKNKVYTTTLSTEGGANHDN